jgi:hypothetical protein
LQRNVSLLQTAEFRFDALGAPCNQIDGGTNASGVHIDIESGFEDGIGGTKRRPILVMKFNVAV